MSRSAFVTGASGFVGSALTGRLLDDGWRVCAALRPTSSQVRLPTGHPRFAVCTLGPAADDFRAALVDHEVDTVFHLASRYVASHAPGDIDDLIEANVTLGARLLDGMARARVDRLVAASSVWLHHEGRDYDPVNLYAATKAAFDAVLRYYTSAHGLRSVTLEIGDTYGPNDPRGKLISALIDAGVSGRALGLSPGEQRIDLTHVDDVTSAFALSADRVAEAAPGVEERFSVLTGDEVSLRDLVSELEGLLGRRIPVEWGAKPYRFREVMQPSTPAPRLPGWQPHVRRIAGLQDLVADAAPR